MLVDINNHKTIFGEGSSGGGKETMVHSGEKVTYCPSCYSATQYVILRGHHIASMTTVSCACASYTLKISELEKQVF